MNIQVAPVEEKSETTLKKSNSNNNVTQNTDVNVNFKNQLNDKLSKLQAMVQACVSESQFNRFKNQTRDKFEGVEKNHDLLKENLDEEVKKLYELIDALKNVDINQIKKELDDTKENME